MSQQVLYTGRKSFVAYVRSAAGTLILMIIFGGLAALLGFAGYPVWGQLLAGLGLISAAGGLHHLLYLRTIEWVIFPEELRVNSGIFPIRKRSIGHPYGTIYEACFNFGNWARIFGYGTCVIRRTEDSATALFASHMHDAAKITRLINAQVKDLRHARKPGTAAQDRIVGMRQSAEVPAAGEDEMEIRNLRFLGIAVTIVLGFMLLNLPRADVEIVAETGVQAPDEAPGVTFLKFNRAPAIGGNGHVVLSGELSGPGISSANRAVIFAGIPRFLHKVAQRGQPAPGTDPGVTFLDVPRLLSGTYNRFVVADSGDVAFFGRVQGTGVGGTNQYGVWAELDGVLTLIARAGQALPGGSTLTVIQDFVFTDAGVVLFVSVDPGTTAILVYRGGALSVVFAAGDSAPGFIDCTINGLFRPVSSPSGKIGFRANLLRNFIGAFCPVTMYIEDGGAFIRAVSTGDLTPPGLPTGTAFAGFSSGANIQLPKINEHGDLIVHSRLVVPNEPGTLASAWIVRTTGDLELLAVEDETLPSDPSIQIKSLSAEGVNAATGYSAMRATLSTGTAILAGEPRSSYSYSPITNIGPIGLTEIARTGEPVAGGMGGVDLLQPRSAVQQ